MSYISGKNIKSLREMKGLTQKQLGDQLGVSEKTISKWETEKGLPDIMMLEPLAHELKISVAELFAGEYKLNANHSANMRRSKFYVCPICGNVVHAMGEGAYSCCGILLPALSAEAMDEKHNIHVERIEHEYYVSLDHPMEKSHYISFIAYVTSDRIHMVKLYPEQDAQVRFQIQGGGSIYAYCNQHGLYEVKVPIH